MRAARTARSFSRSAASRASSASLRGERLEPVEDIVAFEIARRRHVVVLREEFAVFAAELPITSS